MIPLKMLAAANRRALPGTPLPGRGVLSSLLWLAIAFGPMPARAEGTASAEELFRLGQQRAKEGQIDQACELFERSQRLEPALGTLLNLAACHEKQSKFASAWAEYQLSREWARSRGAQESEREQHAASRMRALEPLIPKLRIQLSESHLSQPHAALRLELDGKPLSFTGTSFEVSVDPGAHHLSASAPGKQRWVSDAVFVGPGERALTQVPILGDSAAPGNSSMPSSPSGRVSAASSSSVHASGKDPRRTWGYVLGGTGLAAVGTGVALLLRAQAIDNRSERETAQAQVAMPRDPALEARAIDDYDTATRVQRAGFITVGVGAACLAAGTYLVLSSRSASAHNSSWRLNGAPNGAMLQFRSSF